MQASRENQVMESTFAHRVEGESKIVAIFSRYAIVERF